jgi:hypothetical protein
VLASAHFQPGSFFDPEYGGIISSKIFPNDAMLQPIRPTFHSHCYENLKLNCEILNSSKSLNIIMTIIHFHIPQFLKSMEQNC